MLCIIFDESLTLSGMLNHHRLKFFVATLLLLTLAVAKIASADEPIAQEMRNGSISYCASNAEINTFTEAQKCLFTKDYVPPSLSFAEKKKWLKIEIPNEVNTRAFTLKIQPFLLNRIDVYYELNNEWKQLTTGSNQKIAPGTMVLGGFKLLVPASSSRTSSYYVAISAPDLSYIHINVDPQIAKSGAIKEDVNFELSIQLGILLTVFILSLISHLIDPSVAVGRFTLFSLNLLLCTLLGSGIIMQTLLYNYPELNQWLFQSAISLRIALWVWVTQSLIAPYKAPSWYEKFSRLTYTIVGLKIILSYSINLPVLSVMVGWLMSLTPLIQIYAVYKIPKIPKTLKRVLLLGFSISFMLFILMFTSLIYPTEANSKQPLYLARLTDFTVPILLLSIISFKNRLNRRELTKSKIALKETEAKVAYERKLLSERIILIDMLTHELKNPLASISLATDNLFHTNKKMSQGHQQSVDNIHHSIRDMDEIIERCSLMNKVESQNIQLETNHILLKGLIEEVVLDKQARERIVLQISNDLSLYTDAKFLKIVVRNLIQNAIRYGDEGSKIRVIARTELNMTCIEIINQISPPMQPDENKIFTRYYRHPNAQRSRGAGLGLFITKQICDLLGANIKYRCEDNTINFSVEFANQS